MEFPFPLRVIVNKGEIKFATIVKPDGKVSAQIGADQIKPGSMIDIVPPLGIAEDIVMFTFTVTPDD